MTDDAVEDDEPDLRDPSEQALELLDALRLGLLVTSADRRVNRLDVVVVGAERDAELEQPEPGKRPVS